MLTDSKHLIQKSFIKYMRRRKLYRMWKERERLGLERIRERFKNNKQLVKDIRSGKFKGPWSQKGEEMDKGN